MFPGIPNGCPEFSLVFLDLFGLFGLGSGLLLGLLVLAVVLILLVIHFGFLLFIPAAWPQGQFVPKFRIYPWAGRKNS